MSDTNSYTDLIEHYRNWIFGLPDSEFLQPMLEARFTPEDAQFLAQIPFIGHDIEKLSEKLNIPSGELIKKLDTFAKKGIVFKSTRGDSVRYSLCDSDFVFYRSTGWRTELDDWSHEMAEPQIKYWINAYANGFLGHETQGLRAVPINKTIEDPRKVMPYEDIIKVIENLEYHSVSLCPCARKYNIVPEFYECSHDFERCLHFGDLGRYCVEQGLGREITKEETLEILKRAADEGLVHGVSNSQENIDTICNCCPDCCVFLDSLVKMPGIIPRGHQPSNYIREFREENCIACGVCEKVCPMNAIELKDKKVIFDPERCLGCGVCVYKCKQNATYLKHREGEQNFPKDGREQVTRYLTERGLDPNESFRKNFIM
ncbi:MAG: Ferredoxin [Candidatus Lokiarchaeum sp. GC14_75]|nr:MAG: Ferredoxin [Candidatus Lokiarchaeum sp. GC14_75]HEC37005.1 4Fe-4S dicluster domain-containing protein [bacterium]